MLEKGYQPIQVSIENTTKKYLEFSLQAINIRITSSSEVAKKVLHRTLLRNIPATIHALEANMKLERDYYEKTIRDRNIITPYMLFHGVIFVTTQNYRNNLTITLINCETKEPIIFNIQGL